MTHNPHVRLSEVVMTGFGERLVSLLLTLQRSI